MNYAQPSGGRRLDGPRRAVPKSPYVRPESLGQPVPASSISAPPAITTTDPTVTSDSVIQGKPRRVGPKKNWKKRLAISVLVVFLGTGGYFGVKFALAAGKIIAQNASGGAPALSGEEIDPTRLKGEGDGRINILLMGVGDPGHDGANLSDTMIVASIDPGTKDVAMLSLPRDMYVKIPGKGYSKLNTANVYGGPAAAKKVVSTILDLPIHYYLQMDFSAFKQAVEAVGGVSIDVKEALRDPAYPCEKNEGKECGYFQPAGKQQMNGTQALRYVRCRKGNCGNDFGRSERQQQVMVALRQKALEASTLTNPVKISKLIDAVGSHVKTDLTLSEIQKLAAIAKDVDTSKMSRKVLTDGEDGLLMSGASAFPGAGAILIPKAGPFNYADIQDLAHSIFSDGYIKKENAAIEVQNGTSVNGLAGIVTKTLKGRGYNMLAPLSADKSTYNRTVIYDYSGGKKPYTVNYLERRFGVKVIKATLPQATSAGSAASAVPDIRIVVGADYKTETGQSPASSPLSVAAPRN